MKEKREKKVYINVVLQTPLLILLFASLYIIAMVYVNW